MTEIKQYEFEVNMVEPGKAIHQTPIINGILENIYIYSSGPINLKIFQDIIDFDEKIKLIYFEQSFIGYKRLCLREQPVDNRGKFSFGVEKIAMNESLLFEFNGNYQTNIKVIVKWQ